MKSRKYEKGQAIAELTISLIGIMAVFVGLLCVSGLGIENIENLINARSEADGKAYRGEIDADTGQSIIDWSYGEDELYFTADDQANSGTDEDGGYFSSQLNNGSLNFSNTVNFGGRDLTTNFVDMQSTEMFQWAAMLTSGQSRQDDPLGERNLEDIRGVFSGLMGNDLDFSLEETVYMPVVSN
jgi:hypothetical protein